MRLTLNSVFHRHHNHHGGCACALIQVKKKTSIEAEAERAILDALQAYAAAVEEAGLEIDPDAEEIIRAAFLEAFSPVVEGAAQLGAKQTGMPEDLLVDNPYTAAWLKQYSAELVTSVSRQTKDNIRELLASGMADHLTVAQTARAMRAVLPLNDRQSKAAQYVIDQAIEDGESQDDAVARGEKYARRLLSQRASLIARTEIIRGEAAGLQQSWQVARDEGYVSEKSKRKWIARASSKRICDLCADLAGQEVGMDEPFESDGEEIMMPPRHPACRCTMGLVTK